MRKFVPFDKLAKKKQRELNAAKRGSWGINPVTRVKGSDKAYSRARSKSEERKIRGEIS